LLHLPHVQCPGEQDRFWARFREVARDAQPAGNLVPDAHRVALMIEQGVSVSVSWSRDRDYGRFRAITVRDPIEEATT